MTKRQQLAQERNWALARVKNAEATLRRYIHPIGYQDLDDLVISAKRTIEQQWTAQKAQQKHLSK